jgi:hypothetical protein
MSERTAIRIEVEYDDGYLERAIGDDAQTIMDAIASAMTMNYIHGSSYNGPTMKPVERAAHKQEKETNQ